MAANVQQLISIPDSAETGNAVVRVPATPLNLQWEYTHYPNAWVFDVDTHAWYPELSRMNYRRGLNGQEEDNDTTAPNVFVSKKGATILRNGDVRLGKYRAYRHKTPAIDPQSKSTGYYYHSMFESVTLVGRTPRWSFDQKGYNDFRNYLISHGIIESITRSVVEEKIDELETEVSRLKALPKITSRDERIASCQLLIEAMTESLTEVDANESFEEVEEVEVAPVPQNKTRIRRPVVSAPSEE